MCVVCVTVAGTFLVASQITPIQALSDFTSSQKTLTPFSGSSSTLSTKQKSVIKVLVESNPDAETVTCTGLVQKGASRALVSIARNRAKASCDYAKRLNSFLDSTIVTSIASNRAGVGRVTVSIRTPKPKDLSQHQTITQAAELTDLETCKTEDLTPRSGGSNGFPRPATTLTGTISARILYVPIVFSDLQFNDSDLNRITQAADRVTKFYKETSYGRVLLTSEFLPKNLWVNMSKSAADYRLPENIPQHNKTSMVEDVFRLVDPSVNFNLYDGVVITTGYSQKMHGGQAFTGMTFNTKNGIARGVNLEIGSASGNFRVTAHELGHSLFSLEDLYVFLNPTRPSVPDPQPAGNWDLMSSNAEEFFGWNKLLNGWLDANNVRCLTNQLSSTHYIETIDSPSDKAKLILINLSPGVTLAIEGRFGGILVYKIDSRIQHGDGPISAQKQLITNSDQLTLDGWTIQVRDSDPKGFLVEVLRN
jgi:M6 family metalloprotease-like protein